MIVNTNAVVNPRAVMVETLNASITNCAMLASWGTKNFTIGTHFAGMDFR